METMDIVIKAQAKPKQVISISPTGEMSGLVRKKGQGIDLGQFGNQKIQRATLVEHDEATQKWYINLLHPVQNRDRTNAIVDEVELFSIIGMDEMGRSGHTAYFDDYDVAVKAEIILLDYYRTRSN